MRTFEITIIQIQEPTAPLTCNSRAYELKSFFSPVADEVAIPEAVTRDVEAIREASGLVGLVEALHRVNPGETDFPGLDLQNPRRVEKALIRCLASGRTYRALREEFDSLPPPLAGWEKEVWLIDRAREDLQQRNRSRVAGMLEAGLVDEVRALRARGLEKNPSACGAIGYREVLDHLDGRLAGADLAETIYVHTNQLMRKQRTWFRHQIPVDRVLNEG